MIDKNEPANKNCKKVRDTVSVLDNGYMFLICIPNLGIGLAGQEEEVLWCPFTRITTTTMALTHSAPATMCQAVLCTYTCFTLTEMDLCVRHICAKI